MRAALRATIRSHAGMDALLLLMVIIWGGNYTLLKILFRHIPPMPFNAVRLVVSSLVFLALVWWDDRDRERSSFARLSLRDLAWMGALGLLGHFLYQTLFVVGLSKTSVANSVLIIGCSPVAIALASAAAGHERIARGHWAGLALSLLGLYFVAGHGARFSGESASGDLMIITSVACWAGYTVGCRGLLARHSPLFVNAITIVAGMLAFVPASIPAMGRVAWGDLSPWVWVGTVVSALLAINLAYLIWYTAVQRIGAPRTSVFSNMVPLAGLAIAWVVLDEPIQRSKLLGAACILVGIALTRIANRNRVEQPPEE
ncbi:MAG: DMT family transporter [Acidobacteria bacterium]|jgi:drug/metabolite transporter (DMT)-like permease|nr:DMT family transporter [Acidobacteriota bacterium]